MEAPDGQEERQQDASEAPKLSAAFLPYDDERLWVGMPQDQRAKGRPKKRRPRKRPSSRDGSPPTRISFLSGPISLGRRQIAAAILTLALPVSAFAVTGAISGDVELPDAPVVTSAAPVAIPVTLEIAGLRADRVTSKRVDLSWEAPELDGTLNYEIYRDGVVIAETDQPSFVDMDVVPQRYYYYAVAAVGSDGRAASSPQLLVAVPSETGELPEGPAPAAPAPIVTVITTRSPTPPPKAPSPTGSKIVWPSTDFGNGGGTTTAATTTGATTTTSSTSATSTSSSSTTTTASSSSTATTASDTTSTSTASDTTSTSTASDTSSASSTSETTSTASAATIAALVAGATGGCDPDAESCLSTGALLAIWLLVIPLVVTGRIPEGAKRRLRRLKRTLASGRTR